VREETFDVIRLSGGEPTLHPDLERVLEFLKEERPKASVILLTNGIRLLESRFNDLVSEIYVHYHSENPYVKHAVIYYKKMFKRVTIHVVNINIEHVIRALVLGKELGVPVHVLVLQEQGRAFQLPKSMLSFTGEHGCNKTEKITVTPDLRRVTCTAFKGKEECALEREIDEKKICERS